MPRNGADSGLASHRSLRADGRLFANERDRATGIPELRAQGPVVATSGSHHCAEILPLLRLALRDCLIQPPVPFSYSRPHVARR